MEKENKTAKATPPEDLRKRLMDPNMPKTEVEHWAKREILYLLTEVTMYKKLVKTGFIEGVGISDKADPFVKVELLWEKSTTKAALDPAGVEEGAVCGRGGCLGVLEYPRVENCACHINPPCSACVDNQLVCPACDWEADE